MAQGSRPPVLDAYKKREILAILAMGCSRRAAAKYVGCSPATIRNTAQRDPEFAAQLANAESQAEIGYMKNIRKAANKEQYWRAAAWALERKYPEEYAARKPDVVTRAELTEVLKALADLIVQEVPVAEFRKSVVKRLSSLTAGVEKAPKGLVVPDEDQQ